MTHVFTPMSPNRSKSPSPAVHAPGTDLTAMSQDEFLEESRRIIDLRKSLSGSRGRGTPVEASGRRRDSSDSALQQSPKVDTTMKTESLGGDTMSTSSLRAELHSEGYRAWADAVFTIADANNNGQLSVNELTSMLHGTEHQGFTEWLTFHQGEQFRKEDKDVSGSMEPEELALALKHFHAHVKTSDSKPIKDESMLQTVARKMLEHMYRKCNYAEGGIPSFDSLFQKVDTSGNGLIDLEEVREMLRKVLKISPKNLKDSAIESFFKSIDENGDGDINRKEFIHYMKKMTSKVAKSFVCFPAPPEGWHFAIPEDDHAALKLNAHAYAWDSSQLGGHSGRPPWAIPKTPSEMVRAIRTPQAIGGYCSLSREGTKLPLRFRDPKTIPLKPPLPDLATSLAAQIKVDVAMKEARENTSWDLSGPRYQVTKGPLEGYHSGRLFGEDGYVVPTRYGGYRVRHETPILLKGRPLSYDEEHFAKQRAQRSGQEPLFMPTLPPSTGLYDRLSGVTTTAGLLRKMDLYEDRKARDKANTKKKAQKAARFVPL